MSTIDDAAVYPTANRVPTINVMGVKLIGLTLYKEGGGSQAAVCYCRFMEYESKKERIRNNQNHSNAKNIEPERREICERMLKEGKTRDEIREVTGLATQSISAIKQDTEGVSDKDWKVNMAKLMKTAGLKGAGRLADEIENIHPNFLPTALGIIIDKIAILQDQPTAVVEHRIQRISQDDINRMLKGQKDIIDITPIKDDKTS
jgi:hypothetical protein